jgi:CHAT domain-containing protein
MKTLVKPLSLSIALWFSSTAQATDFDINLRDGLACKQQGLIHQAEQNLLQAQLAAQTPQQQAKAAGELGAIYARLHRYSEAKPLLEKAYQVSQDSQKATYANWLGNLYSAQHESKQANEYYTQAAGLAGDNQALVLRINLNSARGLTPSEHLEALNKLNTQLDAIANTEEKIRLYLNLGEQAHALASESGLSLAYDAFDKAKTLSINTLQASRLQAESLNALASLYEDQKRVDESLRLTWQALALMQNSEERDLLFTLEWRQGRLLRQTQQIEAARSAYQRAVEHLEIIRQDIPVDYQNGKSSFRETLEPVYLGLADLLLQQAKQETGEIKQKHLKTARDTVELIKQTELEDFLGGRCTVENARHASIEEMDDKTAIIYPIILPQRLEILVGTKKGLSQFVVPVEALAFNTQVQKMARNLRNKVPSNMPKLYNWLVLPEETLLKEQGIETLVFVPDGSLRLLPMSALFDGKQYLIEKYAVATSPGLTLFDPKPFQRKTVSTLLLGMSDPGGVVEKLPAPVISGFIHIDENSDTSKDTPAETQSKETENSRNLSEKGRSLRELVRKNNGNIAELMRSAEFIAGVKEQLKLPGVKQEVTALSQQLGENKLLLDNHFTIEHFKEEVMLSPYAIVHIASHGVFGSNAESSFLMSYDDLLHIDDLEMLLKSDKFEKEPIELLTLSACQTAEGDDRAPLGFSGVALKAHARSALGTLWPISDEAAFNLMTHFYQNLIDKKMTKVKALQQAQLVLLKQTDMKNPFYWSPFILVGNWL